MKPFLSYKYYDLFISPPVPNPTVTITSTPVSPIRLIKSTVTLICTVELSSAVDVPVTVNVQLIAPSGSPLTTTLPSVSGLTYTTTAMINSFGRNQSGVYACTATVDLVTVNPFVIGGVGVTGMGAIGTGKLCSILSQSKYRIYMKLYELSANCIHFCHTILFLKLIKVMETSKRSVLMDL